MAPSGKATEHRSLRTSKERSALMSKIRAKDTQPELLVRRTLHCLGYRFRLHVRSLPGCPDIVLPKYRTVIQVKGCFWHGHKCLKGRAPRTNRDYWIPKLANNKSRDLLNEKKLRRMKWRVKTLWECRLKKTRLDELRQLLICYLERPPRLYAAPSTKGSKRGTHS